MPFENASNDPADNQEGGFCRIVDATYWTGTDPGSITIDRLDPNQQYLITGTTLTEHRAAARPGERCRSARAALAASSPTVPTATDALNQPAALAIHPNEGAGCGERDWLIGSNAHQHVRLRRLADSQIDASGKSEGQE
jgi:hypothetical protein